MKKTLCLFCLTSFLVTPAFAQQQLQLSTYYPAPYGRYQQIVVGESVIIQPLATPPTCDGTTDGALYVSQTAGTQLCQGGIWNPVGGFASRKEGTIPVAYLPDPDPTTAGDEPRVGIGTSNPAHALEINNATGDASIFIEGNNSPLLLESGATARIGTTTDDPLQLITGDPASGDTTRLHITNTGNVGIGTTNPSQRLEVTDSMMVNNQSSMAEMVFKTPASEFSIGVDPYEGDSFKIGPTGQPPYLVISPGGGVTIYGTLSVQGASDPAAANVKMKYVDDGSSPGYYATYAP